MRGVKVEMIIKMMENAIRKIEESMKYLDVSEWTNEFEDYLKNSIKVVTEEDLVSFLNSIRFYIKADNSEFFREIKTDFNDTYADIDFVYSVNEGIEYTTNSCVVEVLDGSDDEQVFDAIEEIVPDRLNSVKLQWIFWTAKQKENYLLELEELNNKKINELKEKLVESYFKKIEEEMKEKVSNIALKEFGF